MKTLARTLWETLKFEAVCKLLTVCLVYPLLYGVYRIYAASEGLNFNSGVASAFSSPAGVVVLLVLAVGAVAFVFWELSTVVRIVVLTRQGQKFTWRELWWGSLWGLGALRGWSLPTSALFYLGVLPLAGFGYVNSLLPTLSVPEFIFSELRRYGSLGMVAMILLPALGYLLAAALVFVPLSMALCRRTFFQAAQESLLAWGRSFRREGRWSGRGFAVLGALLLWLALFTKVTQYWRRNRLGLVDFDAAFFRNLLYSEAFRIDFAYWVVRAVLDTVAMALFIRVLLAVADPKKQLRVLPNPTWQGDAAVLAGVLRRQLGRLRRWVLARWKRWGVRVTAVALCLGLAAWMLAGSPPPQLLHPPVVIGHRGCIYETENTLAAVRAAGDYGAQYAEIDVQLSADGVPVVLHDGNLWRLAGENRSVADLTAEELTSLPLLPTGYGQAGEHIPTLEQVLQQAGFPLCIVGVQLGVSLAARLFQRRDAPGEIAAQAVGQLYLYDVRFPVFSVGWGHEPVGAAGQRLAHGDVPLPL
ncbi:MAG: glycerophosphodiester phosphodiesterase family protein [Acutalibacter sp.]